MIGKAVKGQSFRGLARYLARDAARVAWTGGFNIIMEDPIEVAREMEDVAALKDRCKTPVYHLPLSWHPDDHPTQAQMEFACQRVLGASGAAGASGVAGRAQRQASRPRTHHGESGAPRRRAQGVGRLAARPRRGPSAPSSPSFAFWSRRWGGPSRLATLLPPLGTIPPTGGVRVPGTVCASVRRSRSGWGRRCKTHVRGRSCRPCWRVAGCTWRRGRAAW